MKLSFYDPEPFKNDYLSIVYLIELRKFCVDNGISIEDIQDLMTVRNSIVLVHFAYLENGVITRLKENGNTIISFDINDHTYFTDCVSHDEIMQIDRIFKIAGIQKTESSYEVQIDDDLNYSRKKMTFRGGNYGKYFDVVAADKMRPLPHAPWNPVVSDPVPWQDRNKLVLLRGSHQYLRVHLFLHLVKNGLVDQMSMFPASMYTHQYCDGCVQAYKDHGRITYENMTDTPCRLKYWKGNFMDDADAWNNKCVPRYLDLAKMFHEKHGGFDVYLFERAFDAQWSTDWMNTILNRYLFYADFKWIFSIYTPPRFWEAAGAGTINLVTERLIDQEQFPKIEKDVHYLTFKEDFSDLNSVRDVTREQFEEISNNCLDLYNTWIKPERYGISENLLKHIMEEIENV